MFPKFSDVSSLSSLPLEFQLIVSRHCNAIWRTNKLSGGIENANVVLCLPGNTGLPRDNFHFRSSRCGEEDRPGSDVAAIAACPEPTQSFKLLPYIFHPSRNCFRRQECFELLGPVGISWV